MVAQATLKSTMFADSLLETSRSQTTRRSWTTLTSFALEALAIGLLLLLPLWKTVGLPAVRPLSTPLALGHAGPAPVSHARSSSPTHPMTTSVTPILVAPGHTPRRIDMTPDSSDPAPIGDAFSSSSIGSPDGPLGIPSMLSGTRPVMPAAPAPAPTVSHFRTSTILEGNLIRKVQPVYPPLARAARIQGPVVLFAMISKAGTIDNLRLVSGHPMLSPAAIEAVSQWRYRPYILNGEPIEVETQITVNFTLAN